MSDRKNKLTAIFCSFAATYFFSVVPLSAQTFNATRIDGRPATRVSDPLVDLSTFSAVGGASAGGNIDGPSVIRLPDWIPAEERVHPSAVYYMYFANHTGHDIRLAWSDSLTGTWTLFNRGTAPDRAWGTGGNNSGTQTPGNGVLDIDLGPSFPGLGRTLTAASTNGVNPDGNIIGTWGHIASPDVIVDDVDQRIVMYFHGNSNHRGVQKTFVATSAFGLNFNPVHEGGEPGQGMRDTIVAEYYFRVFQVGGRTFGYSNVAELWRAPATNDAREINTLSNADTEGGLWNPSPSHTYGEIWWEQMALSSNPIETIYSENGQGINDPRHFSTYTRTHRDPSDTNVYVFYSSRYDEPESIFLTVIDTDGGSTDPSDWTPIGQRIILEPDLIWEGVDLPIAPSQNGGSVGVRELRDPYVFEDTMGTPDLADDRLYLFYTGRGEEAIGVAELFFDEAIANTAAPQGDLGLGPVDPPSPPTSAATLFVDVTGTTGTGRTQAGYQLFLGGATNSLVDLSKTYVDVFGEGASATVRLHADRWKTRTANTSGDASAVAMSDLLYDFGGPQNGQTAVLGLTLPVGTYDITVYHHESSRTSAADAVMTLIDSNGSRTPINLLSGYGSSPATAPVVFSTKIQSDGTNEITFSYDNQDLSGNTSAFPINGLDLTFTPDFANWIGRFGLNPAELNFDDNPDGDNLPNGLEAWFGTHPGQFNPGPTALTTDGTTATFTHPNNETPPTGISGSYEWSLNLTNWYAGDGIDGPIGGTNVAISPDTVGTTTTVTATTSEPTDYIFLRVRGILVAP